MRSQPSSATSITSVERANAAGRLELDVRRGGPPHQAQVVERGTAVP